MRYNKKTEMLYGFHSVFEALNACKRLIYKVFFVENNNSDRECLILNLAKVLNIDCEIVKSSKMKLITKTEAHQGFSALVSPLPTYSINDLIKKKFLSESSIVVILDGVLDPHNFGAIVRTAHCVGVSSVVIAKNRTCFPTPSVSKVSAGSLEHMPICRVTNLSNTIKKLKKEGFWVAGMEFSECASSIFDTNMVGLMVFVVGGESKGLRPLVRSQCDFFISIPMFGKLDSLNVSVATAVVLYENFRQRLL